MVMEVPVGLGPLHTQFDGKGYAYTSLFVESAIAKWKLPPYAAATDPKSLVVDKIPVQFNVGHLVTAHGDTRHPKGDWLVAMNKMSKGRLHQRSGRRMPESSAADRHHRQREDEDGLRGLHRARAALRPADAQGRAQEHHRVLSQGREPPQARDLGGQATPRSPATRPPARSRATVFAIRTYFEPGRIQVQEGDTVILHITNAEQARDEIHGFGLVDRSTRTS